MRGSLIGENIRHHTAFGKFGNNVCAVADEADRNIFFFADGIFQNSQRFVKRGHKKIAVACLEPLLDALGIDINPQERRAGHRRRQWLRAAHPAHAAGDDQLAAQISAKMFVGGGVESFICALHNSL